MGRGVEDWMYPHYFSEFRKESPDAPLEEIVARAQKEAKGAQIFWDLSTIKNLAQWIVLPETFIAYAMKGYANASGQDVPIPDSILNVGLAVPAVNVPLGAVFGKKMSQHDQLYEKPTNMKLNILKGASVGTGVTGAVAALGYGVGYAVGSKITF